MPAGVLQPLGTFATGRKTASVNTAFAIPIFPFGGLTGTPLSTRRPAQATAGRQGIIHVTGLFINQATTNQLLVFMRPLNWTYFAAAGAAAQTTVTLNADPGLYSANRWRGGAALPNGQSAPSTADTAVASGDYCIYQATSGIWVMDTAAGTVSAGALTMTTNLPTGGVSVGGLFYWFGPASANTDPANNLACPSMGTGFQTLGVLISIVDNTNGLCNTLYPGDPMIVYNPNATTVSVIENCVGYFSKH